MKQTAVNILVCGVVVMILAAAALAVLVCLPISYLIGRGKPWAWWWRGHGRNQWWQNE